MRGKLRTKAPKKIRSSLRKNKDNRAEMGQFAAHQIVGPGGAVMLRPRICYVLSLLRIHNPDCKHCAAHLICGNELRKRLEELNEPRQAISDRFPDAGGIAVNVKTKNSHGVRAVQLPATMLQSVKQRNAA